MEIRVVHRLPKDGKAEALAPRIGPEWYARHLPSEKPVLVLDSEARLRFATDAACRLFGFEGESYYNRCFFNCIHGSSLPLVMRDLADMVCYGKTSAAWLLCVRGQGGKRRWMKATANSRLAMAEDAITVSLHPIS